MCKIGVTVGYEINNFSASRGLASSPRIRNISTRNPLQGLHPWTPPEALFQAPYSAFSVSNAGPATEKKVLNENKQMVKVILHRAASPLHTDGSVVFARSAINQCIPVGIRNVPVLSTVDSL